MKPTVTLIDFRLYQAPGEFMIEKIGGIEHQNITDHYQCGSFISARTTKVMIDMEWKINTRLPNKKDWDALEGRKEVKKEKKSRVERKTFKLKIRRDK